MRQQALIDRIAAVLADDPRVTAAWLGGSFGRGDADAYSDVDVLALVEESSAGDFIAGWEALLERIAPTVHRQRLGFGTSAVLNAITTEWERFDISVVQRAALAGRSQSALRLLFEREEVHATLPARGRVKEPSAERVAELVREFLRVLGLAVVVMHRDELVVAVNGTGILRDLLVRLIREELRVEDRGGALRLEAFLDPELRSALRDLPAARPERASLIAANTALARLFLPRARRLAEQTGAEWPEDFERATRRWLARHLDGLAI